MIRNQWYEWEQAPSADFAVIGDPIAHSLSPLIHNAVLNHLDLPKVYHAIRVPSKDFFEAIKHLQSLGYLGLNVTAPLKEKAYDWACNKNLNIHCYNTLNLKNQKGINTDQPGFYKTLIDKKWDKPCSVLFLGGGATTKSLASLLGEKKIDIHIFARNPNKIKDWMNHYPYPIHVHSDLKHIPVELIVNTLSPSQLITYSTNLNYFTPSTKFYDLNYAFYLHPSYQYIQKRFEYINGLLMLIEQGALSLEWWLGHSIPKDIMIRALPYFNM